MRGVTLAAEHGFHYRLGNFPGVRSMRTGASGSGAGWQQLIEGFDLSWKANTRVIMEAYTARTNGASIQDKGACLVWKYDDVDPEFGSMQVKELHQHLRQVLAPHPLEVTLGKGYLEVRPAGVNKGAIADHIVSQACNHHV